MRLMSANRASTDPGPTGVGIDEQVVEVAGDHAAQWPDPLAKVSQPLRFAGLDAGIVDRHCNEGLDAVVVVDPCPRSDADVRRWSASDRSRRTP